jgi:dihydrofolate reductase
MALLLYSALMSLDGFIEDDSGRFDWAVPDPELHDFINRLESGVGTHLYGRRMYETMAVWETLGDEPGSEAEEVAYAELWRALDKIVYSTSLDAVWTPRTTLERSFDPGAVAHLKEMAVGDISVSGPRLAQHAFAAGLVDELHLFWFPVVVGAGKPGIPAGVRFEVELIESQQFSSGVVYTRHGCG